jgi:ribosomal-protein-alanine N-acetyltransferase
MQNGPVTLRPTQPADFAFLFPFQLDLVATHLAAFTPPDHANQASYVAKYTRFIQDPTITMRTILVAEVIVGSLAKFEAEGRAELTYWLDRSHWGKGIATAALQLFLAIETSRPLFGRVAFDNVGSQRVLEKSGFVRIGTASGFARARQMEIAEFIYKLA